MVVRKRISTHRRTSGRVRILLIPVRPKPTFYKLTDNTEDLRILRSIPVRHDSVRLLVEPCQRKRLGLLRVHQ